MPAVSDDPGYVVPEIPEEAIARGRDLVGRLMESGTVCGFKDPRTVQVWPYWQRVFAGLPELRVVPLFLVRGPHEIAMSIFRRSQGDRDYAQALDVTAVHFRRMKDICDQWSGPWCVVQFDPQVCGLQLRRAAELCGLNWSDSAFAEVYDASCRHHEAAVVDHPAQAAFEALAGPGSSRRSAGNDRQLLADAAVREATLRQRRDLRRQERDTARWEVAALQHENASLRQTVATIPPLQARLAQTTYDLNLIQNSRTWRAREALANVMRFGRAATHDPEYQAPRPPCPGNADQEIHSKPRPDPQAGARRPTTTMHPWSRSACITAKGKIMRALEYVRRFRNYQKRFGIKAAVNKAFEYLAGRVTPPAPGPFYPTDILWAMEQQPNVAEHADITREMNDAWMRNPQPPRRVLWLMPDFRSVHNGGPNTILRFAHHFARRGAECIVYIFNGCVHDSADQARMEIFEALGAEPRLKVVLNRYDRPLRPDELPESDMAVATLWNTAYILLQYHRTKCKLYLIQDYETQFYPGSIESALADLTYDFGFLGLFNTPGLRDAVMANHAISGYAFQPGIDHDVFFPRRPCEHGARELPDLRRMFFYGRPEVPRNGYSLGMHGLHLIQQAYADSEVFVAGHTKAYAQSGLRGQFLPYMDYRATGDMYRSCGSLISFMFTPHPSYIPLQAMCCGSIPIARRDRYTSWALKDGHNCLLVDPLPHQILEAYARLRRDADLRDHLYENAIHTFDGITWPDQLQRAYRWFVEGKDEGGRMKDGAPAERVGGRVSRKGQLHA